MATTQRKYLTGIESLIKQFKTLASYNRVNEFYVIGEFTQNKYNSMASDFHIRGIYNSTTHAKLQFPSSMARICYNMTNTIQPQSFKLYHFKLEPLEFTYAEDMMDEISREYKEGKYGAYYEYKWNDIDEASSFSKLGKIFL